MSAAPPVTAPPPEAMPRGALKGALAAYGEWLRRHGRALRALQWVVVVVYAVLVAVPAFLPLPADDARARQPHRLAQWAWAGGRS